MPLVLSLKEGQDFYVGEDQFFVTRLYGELAFSLKREADGKIFDITDAHATEISKDVWVSAGDNPPASTARLSIEAPRNILVLRGEKKRNPPEHLRPMVA